jgi:hypothetical protein
MSAGFGRTLRRRNNDRKCEELEWNTGCLGGFERPFDGRIEALINLMESVTDNEIPGDLTTHSDAHAAIARVGHTEPGS